MSTSRWYLGWRSTGGALILTVACCGNAVGQWGRSGSNSDANHGLSWSGSSNNPRMNSHGNNDAANIISGIGGILDGVIKGAQANEQRQRQMQPWPSERRTSQQMQPRYQQPQYQQPQYQQPQYQQPQYQQPQYQQPPPRYVEPRPVYVPPPVEKKVSVQANPKPVEKVAKPKNNLKLMLAGLSLANGTEMGLLKDVVEKEAKEDFDQIVAGLGTEVIKDPEVAKILEEGRQAVIDGKELDPTFKDRLKSAVGDALKKDKNLKTAVTPAAFDDLVEEFEKTSSANAALQQSGNDANGGGLFPSGNTQVVFIPALGADDVLIVPGGSAIVMGTGGEGGIDTMQVDAAEALGIPLGVGEPEPNTNVDVAKRVKEGVLLSNPEENDVPINYVLANHNYSMKPGFSQTLDASKSWEIRFSRGDDSGEAKYTLKDGTYFFGSSGKGWELYRQSFSVTIDNTSNEQPFNYVADNTEVTIPAGMTKSHSSNFPILLRFDRGDGGKEALKKVSKNDQHLKIGIRPTDGLWDLFPQEASLTLADASENRPTMSAAPEKASARVTRLRALLQASKK